MVLSLASNPSCLLLDDELNILPTSSHVSRIEPLPADADTLGASSAKDTELKGLTDSLSDTLVSVLYTATPELNRNFKFVWFVFHVWRRHATYVRYEVVFCSQAKFWAGSRPLAIRKTWWKAATGLSAVGLRLGHQPTIIVVIRGNSCNVRDHGVGTLQR